MNMLQDLIQSLRPASPDALAVAELEEARRELLKAQSGREYAAAMVAYHSARIERLSAIVKAGGAA